MIRIGHLIPNLDFGGAERSLLQLCERIQDRGIQSAIVQLRAGGSLRPLFAKAGVEVLDVGIRGSLPTAADLVRLVKLVRGLDPDILQGWMYHGLIAATAVSAGLRRSVPLVWAIRTSLTSHPDLRSAAPSLVGISRMLRRSPDLILFNSRAGRRSHLAAGVRGRRNKVLPNGFDLSRFRPDPEARRRIRDLLGLRDELVLGCVARLDPLKGHRVLLEAFSQVRRAIPEARLLLVGTGVSFDNPDFAAALPRSLDPSSVIAAGPADDVPPWLAAMDIAVMPSLVEGFPNALGEAMSCGLVCIATDAGDAKRMLGTHGHLVPTGEVEALASAMVAASRREEAQRRDMGLAARARIAQHYSLERTIDAHAILYRRLADGVSGRASRHHA